MSLRFSLIITILSLTIFGFTLKKNKLKHYKLNKGRKEKKELIKDKEFISKNLRKIEKEIYVFKSKQINFTQKVELQEIEDKLILLNKIKSGDFLSEKLDKSKIIKL